LQVVTHPDVDSQVAQRLPLVLSIPVDPVILQLADDIRERCGEGGGVAQRGNRGRRAVEELVAGKRPRAEVRDDVLWRDIARVLGAELQLVAAGGVRVVLLQLESLGEVQAAGTRPPVHAWEVVDLRVAIETLRGEFARTIPQRRSRRSGGAVKTRRILDAEFIQGAIA